MKKINWDALGVFTSLACAIHCALLPLVLTSLPLFGINIIDSVAFESIMIFVAFSVGAGALYHGWKKHHHSWWPVIIFFLGMLMLCAKQIWHAYHLLFLFPAVLFIVGAHFINYRLCKNANKL